MTHKSFQWRNHQLSQYEKKFKFTISNHTVVGLSFCIVSACVLFSMYRQKKKQQNNEMIMTNDQVVFSKVTNMRLQRQYSVTDRNLINEECAFSIYCCVNQWFVRARLNSLAICIFANLIKEENGTYTHTFAYTYLWPISYGATRGCELLNIEITKRRQQQLIKRFIIENCVLFTLFAIRFVFICVNLA